MLVYVLLTLLLKGIHCVVTSTTFLVTCYVSGNALSTVLLIGWVMVGVMTTITLMILWEQRTYRWVFNQNQIRDVIPQHVSMTKAIVLVSEYMRSFYSLATILYESK